MQVQDRIVLVTGAAQGIGAAIAKKFAKEGARAIGLVDQRDTAKTGNEILKYGAQVQHFHGDVTDKGFRESVFAEMLRVNEKPVSIVVPAAGITRDKLAVKFNKTTSEYELYDEATYRLVLEVNLMHPVFWAMEMAKGLMNGEWTPGAPLQGVAVFIGSISAQGNMGQISYASTKAALSAAASTFRTEWKTKGIKAVVVHPGFTGTEMVAAMPPKVLEMLLGRTQLGRLIAPEEIADGVVFATKNDAITEDIRIDGGYHSVA